MSIENNDLRRLALTVDEPSPGLYFWVLQEECDEMGIYEPVEAAELPMDSYHAALAAGYVALQAVSGPTGPRQGQRHAPIFISPSMEFMSQTLQ
jgi:hypothetical protein